jgi:hypothetical protein
VRVCAACGDESPEGFRHCGFCGAALTAPAAGRRMLATLVVCDVAGSTALGERVDPESVQELMQIGEARSLPRGALGTFAGSGDVERGSALVGLRSVARAQSV